MAGRTIITNNAIVNGQHTLIKSIQKYLLFETEHHDSRSLIKAVYRRMFRLQSFISNRAMVRETYREYLRYKFRHEDYATKRSIVVGDTPSVPLEEELKNSLMFIIKSVCHLPESKEHKLSIARDNTICRQVLKNLLTVEYEKQSLIAKYKPPLKKGEMTGPYQIYRTEFTHMRECNQSAQARVLGEYDICMIYMNETLHTRL